MRAAMGGTRRITPLQAKILFFSELIDNTYMNYFEHKKPKSEV